MFTSFTPQSFERFSIYFTKALRSATDERTESNDYYMYYRLLVTQVKICKHTSREILRCGIHNLLCRFVCICLELADRQVLTTQSIVITVLKVVCLSFFYFTVLTFFTQTCIKKTKVFYRCCKLYLFFHIGQTGGGLGSHKLV